ncbi:MAG: aromatic ring-hydroxylating dioxygenase subunit alpha [Sphingomonadales bacterium]|nr:aromatic ring-hydroxylating dioxygenase subunit alpha [Sphingomonadales bacterium]
MTTAAPRPRQPEQAATLDADWAALLQAEAASVLRHKAMGTFPLAPAQMTVPAADYTCPALFEQERSRLFRRLPLLLAASAELRAPGDFKTMHIAGVPVLVVRGRDGQARAFLNSCTHRGSPVAAGCGSARRFVCPYHGWTFDAAGSLIGVASPEDFGAVDKAAFGLRAFPTVERAGLVWAILDPASPHDLGALLGGIDGVLGGFGLEHWSVVQSRAIAGPNWKLAFDAHLEFYHLPVLHRESFGPDRSNRALYFAYGPHQRLISPRTRTDIPTHADLLAHDSGPGGAVDGEITRPIGTEALLAGEWIVFPTVSINSFYPGGKRGIFLSQVFPGASVAESVTIQTYLAAQPPSDEDLQRIAALCDVLGGAVADEDIPTSFRQQQALASGLLGAVTFGRNEGGLQHFHRWIRAVVAAADEDLPALLGAPLTPA